MVAQTQLPGNIGYLDWSNWAYGLVSGIISGGASAVVSGMTVVAMDPSDYNFHTGKFYTLVALLFLVNGTMGAMMFLRNQPLPSKITVKETDTTETRRNPASVIVKHERETTTIPVVKE